jgi:hypothetical protein
MKSRKSRKQLKITAEMAAEDSFRYRLWEECEEPPALDNVCFWYKNQIGTSFPKYKNGDHQYKKAYNKHLALLNKTFMEESSRFKLKWTTYGIGVFARTDMKIVRQEGGEGYGHDTGLSAEYQGVVKGVNWSIGMVTIPKITVGRPRQVEEGRRKSSDRIRANTMELTRKSLVGPFNFINHACDECAQLEWEENAVKKSIHVTAKKGKIIKKDDEVFINYKGVECEVGDVFPCGMCAKFAAVSSTVASASSTNAVVSSSAATAVSSTAYTTVSAASASSTNDMEIDDETVHSIQVYWQH